MKTPDQRKSNRTSGGGYKVKNNAIGADGRIRTTRLGGYKRKMSNRDPRLSGRDPRHSRYPKLTTQYQQVYYDTIHRYRDSNDAASLRRPYTHVGGEKGTRLRADNPQQGVGTTGAVLMVNANPQVIGGGTGAIFANTQFIVATGASLMGAYPGVCDPMYTITGALQYSGAVADQRYSGADQRYSGADQRYSAADQRSSGVDQRYSAADQRSSGADQRSSGADQRSSGADKRSSVADQRYSVADQRYSVADQRYSVVDPRYSVADQRYSVVDPRYSGADPRYSGADQTKRSNQLYNGDINRTYATGYAIAAYTTSDHLRLQQISDNHVGTYTTNNYSGKETVDSGYKGVDAPQMNGSDQRVADLKSSTVDNLRFERRVGKYYREEGTEPLKDKKTRKEEVAGHRWVERQRVVAASADTGRSNMKADGRYRYSRWNTRHHTKTTDDRSNTRTF